MRKVAHVESGKIVNISLHNSCPKGKQHLDVTDLAHADIGCEVINGKVIHKNAVKDLENAKKACFIYIQKQLNQSRFDIADGFQINSLSELYSTYELMGDVAVTMCNDLGVSVRLSRRELLATMQKLFVMKQTANSEFAFAHSEIENAKSPSELSEKFPHVLPKHLVHPEAQ